MAALDTTILNDAFNQAMRDTQPHQPQREPTRERIISKANENRIMIGLEFIRQTPPFKRRATIFAGFGLTDFALPVFDSRRMRIAVSQSPHGRAEIQDIKVTEVRQVLAFLHIHLIDQSRGLPYLRRKGGWQLEMSARLHQTPTELLKVCS